MRAVQTCQYCGFKSANGSMDRNKTGRYCRSEIACFNRILARMRASESAGRGMANLCFNLSQQSGKTLTDDICRLMRDFCRKWDQRRKS